ncbi:TPA: hypothetical protein U1199_000462 [Streptococcus suis]|nr:hypothetical protein [Streptococcus suis]HEM5046271.1 hypothetical protein [Streptococcus suis]HEM5265563.1 hypothetical protein [Streptococcus suis]
MFERFSRLKKGLKILELYKEHPIITLISGLYGLLNFGLSVWVISQSSQELWIISVVAVSMIILFFFWIIGVSLWSKYRYLKNFSNSIHIFIKDTSLTDIEYLSKLEKEDERFLQSPLMNQLYRLTPQEIRKEQRVFNKKYSSWTKTYLKSVFDELDSFLEDSINGHVDITLQLLTERFNPSKVNLYYDAFVDKNRKSTKNHSPVVLNDTMELLIHFKEHVKRYSIRDGNTLVFALSTVNINNDPPVLYGFISFKFNSIDEESEQFKLLLDCLIAKVEELCYYIKVLEGSYRLYPAAVYSAAEAIESENERNEYIDMAIKLGEDLDFLRCIYTDFISGGIDNDD